MAKERTVVTAGPFELMHRTVGCSRYWYVRHAPTGKYAAMLDAAPCKERVDAVKAKFLTLTAGWPDMSAWDPYAATPDEIRRVRTLQGMMVRAGEFGTRYELAAL